ncbi:RagB/SusD family nutrient uptake outer membrane protein [Bacteroides heparinolyticus]|uniref:RagB/SusD family nutrient uptake outer membrane protein n=1 Tax=Prevotella heparinolytica TaxID=28113 RepID=UPI0035A0A59E
MNVMKYTIPVLLAGMLALQSCEHFLDTKPTETYSEELVWGTRSTADAFVLRTYPGVLALYHDFWGDDKMTLNTIERQSCPGEARDLMNREYDFGFNRFGLIRRCNLIVEQASASSALSTADKKELVAEGKMLRAMIYYYLAKHCGRVIWVDRVLTVEDEFNLPLTESVDKTYDLILNDLDEAIGGLPESYPAGRATAHAARALKSEVCLTAAAYSTDATRRNALWKQAVEAVDAIRGYELDANYGGMFNQENPYASSEIMLARYFSKENTTGGDTYMQTVIPNQGNDNLRQRGRGPLFKRDWVFECWLEHSPSQNLVDDYLVVDQLTGEAKRWNLTTQFVNNTRRISNEAVKDLAVNDDELDEHTLAYETIDKTQKTRINDVMYTHRDKRFYATIVHDSCEFYGELVTMHKTGNLQRCSLGEAPGTAEMGSTNYLWRKGVYINDWRIFYDVPTNYHYVIFRYGRALLNKAEALLCLAKNDAGKLPEAVATLNRTRTVHGGLPASKATALVDAWRDYKIERHVELPMESDYYWSLLRWGKYGEEANNGEAPGSEVIEELHTPATFIEISSDRHRMFIGKQGYENDNRTFSKRRYLFPIPQGLINANSAVTEKEQNPYW